MTELESDSIDLPSSAAEVRELNARLRALARAVVGDEALAEDVVQADGQQRIRYATLNCRHGRMVIDQDVIAGTRGSDRPEVIRIRRHVVDQHARC